MDDKKIKGKRRKRCENCFCLKYDVQKIINPYDQDIYDIENEEYLCPECYINLKCDI